MPSQRGVSPGGAGGGLRRGSGLGDAADAALAVLIAGMDTRGGGAADCLLRDTIMMRLAKSLTILVATHTAESSQQAHGTQSA